MLEISNLNVSYGSVQVLDQISLSVRQGEAVGLLGANGAGKTTALSTISGIHRGTNGSIRFCGQEISQSEAHTLVAIGLAHVPEGRRIFSRLTVEENLLLGAYTQGDKSRIKRSLERVYSIFPILTERRSQFGGTLSGGEQQMLAISRALMSEPKLLLLDEPSMGIAPLLVTRIFEALLDLKHQGMTILLVEQNAHLALNFCERAYVLETGRITISGLGKDLLNNPNVRAAYLGV